MYDEIKEEVKDCIEDEKRDWHKYEEMAKEMRAAGHEHYAGILEDIAHDEEMHMKYLKGMHEKM